MKAWLPALLAVVVAAAYHNSFSGGFLFDDRPVITENASLRHLWPPGPALWAPARSGTAGRPLANLSFAANYALGGLRPGGYHAVNLALHAAAVLALFGVVRRTLRSPRLAPDWAGPAAGIAAAAAALWGLHPVQTASVTYLSQRTEELMGLFSLLTLYCFIRYAEVAPDLRAGEGDAAGRTSPARRSGATYWPALSVACCFLGMASKESMASAPLLVLLYDRVFLAGSFGAAWARRRLFYAALAASWLALALLLAASHPVRRAVGFGLGVGAPAYFLTECRAVLLYLKLMVWPHPLVFDHGPIFLVPAAAALPYLLVLAPLAAGAAALLWRNRPVGFGLAWFFIVLAPTSSFVPVVSQPVAENRLYLAMAGPIAVFAAALYRALGRRAALGAVAILAAAALAATVNRNRGYGSEEGIWRDTVRSAPQNPRARYNLGKILLDRGRDAEAAVLFREAIGLAPDYAEAHANLGLTFLNQGRIDPAMVEFRLARRLQPGQLAARVDLANALRQKGETKEAWRELTEALRIDPESGAAHYNLSLTLRDQGRPEEAGRELRAALRFAPDMAEAHLELGNEYQRAGNWAAAAAEFERALALRPRYPEAFNNLGNAYLDEGRRTEAIDAYRAALRLRPAYAEAQYNLAIALKASKIAGRP